MSFLDFSKNDISMTKIRRFTIKIFEISYLNKSITLSMPLLLLLYGDDFQLHRKQSKYLDYQSPHQ